MATWMHEHCCVRALGRTAILALVLLLSQAEVVLAARGGIPGPPPPPCISAGPISVSGCFACLVRNVSNVNHFVTAQLVDPANNAINTFSSLHGILAPGTTEFIEACPTLTLHSCVVTTEEGTPDALQDLAVVLQTLNAERTLPLGQTEGKIYQQCAPAKLPPP